MVDGFGVRLISHTAFQVHRLSRRKPVAPGRFHQHSPGTAVTGQSDLTLAAARTAAVFAGHQPQKTHQLAWRIETANIAEFGQQHHGC